MQIFTFGCSFTAGQGLNNPREESYSAIIQKITGIKTINFGQPGASNDYIFRKVFEYLKHYIQKDDLIIIQWTNFIRKELPIEYENKKFYLYAPNCSYPMTPNVFNEKLNVVHTKYLDINLEDTSKKIIETYNSFFNEYIDKALQEEYQIETTENYIHSLYSYLEYNGYKHLHFFGWDSCKEPYKFSYEKFLDKTFGGYTNTKGSEHPDKFGHDMWAKYLIPKIKELI